uniref:Uncharacterized protein n=1 Tax=Triticum aestivum TaxID=4565 RepID=A0A077RYL3_WHEAT|nr:unnamed protein product [Triticum aestivum]
MKGGGKKFGGGRLPTGTPSLAWSSVVVVASLLAGASVVHNVYKPDMVWYTSLVSATATHPSVAPCAQPVRRNARSRLTALSFLLTHPQTIPPVESADGGRGGNDGKQN